MSFYCFSPQNRVAAPKQRVCGGPPGGSLSCKGHCGSAGPTARAVRTSTQHDVRVQGSSRVTYWGAGTHPWAAQPQYSQLLELSQAVKEGGGELVQSVGRQVTA